MALSRYAVPDAYTLEELRHKYQRLDAKGRIRLLRKLYKEGVPLYEVALMAVEDPNVEVRQWIARHGKYLDYTDEKESNYQEKQADEVTLYDADSKAIPKQRSSSRNLEERLKNDPDPFVRACLRENPTAIHGSFFEGIPLPEDWKVSFQEATYLERLALVRNPEVDQEFIEWIFDPEDKKLSITLEERKELVLAFLTNKEALDRAEETARLPLSQWPVEDYGMNVYSAGGFLSTLWKLASKWPLETKIPGGVYLYMTFG